MPAVPIPAPRRLRLAAAALLALAVLVTHLWLLGQSATAPGYGRQGQGQRQGQGPRALQVRTIPDSATARAAAAAVPAVAAPAPQPAPARAALPRRQAVVAARIVAPARPPRVPADSDAAPAPLPDAAEAVVPAADASGAAVPVYATRLPAPTTLVYRYARAYGSGSAELSWRLQGSSYELTLHARGGGSGGAAVGWTSRGEIDAHGIAPERYTESRRGHDLRAANFQRAAGRLTFSGPQAEYPLLPGAQDRLSWMVQLPAVLAADPTLAEPGRQIALFVAGARGDAGVWTFTVVGVEDTELPAGTAPGTVRLERTAQHPYDTDVQVWLDPARQHLPVRVRLRVAASGAATELLLDSAAAP